jgi:hypothetical protein
MATLCNNSQQHHLQLQLPDGSRQALPPTGVTFGRGNPPSLQDDFLSREHVALAPVDGLPDAAMLTNLGRNRECVLSRVCGTAWRRACVSAHACTDTLAPAPAPTSPPDTHTHTHTPMTRANTAALVVQVCAPGRDPQAHSSWSQAAYLGAGQDCCVAPGSAFFVAAREHTTRFVLLPPAPAPAGAAGQGSSGSGAASTAAATDTPAAAAAAAAAAAGAPCEEQIASDAALAAALAAADAAGDADDAYAAAVADGWQPAKRQRVAGARSSSSGAARISNAEPPPSPPPALGDTPCALLSVT